MMWVLDRDLYQRIIIDQRGADQILYTFHRND